MLTELLNRTVHTLLFLVAFIFMSYTFAEAAPEEKLVFDCYISQDGTCFSIEHSPKVRDCYTATGIYLGACEVKDYLKLGGAVCNPASDWCKLTYMPNRLRALGKDRRDLVVFKMPNSDGGIEDAFCHATPSGSACYNIKGFKLPSDNWESLADKTFNVCHPKYEECLLTPAMMEDSY